MDKVLEWNGLTRGDPVKVKGLRGSFHFEAYSVNGNNCWVDVFGGVPNRECWRSVTPDRITGLKRKKVSRGSADENQTDPSIVDNTVGRRKTKPNLRRKAVRRV